MTSPSIGAALAHARSHRVPEAIRVLEEALASSPADTDALHLLADLLLKTGRAGEAAARYERAATVLPDDTTIRSGWAFAALLSGAMQEAKRQLRRTLELDPRFADRNGHLRPLLRSAVAPESRCEILDFLLERWPRHTGLLRLYGEACLEAERPAQARVALERLRALAPRDPYPHVELGRLAVSFGDKPRARAHFRDALDVAPDYAAALWNMAQLDGGRIDETLALDAERMLRLEKDPKALAGLHDILARHHDSAGRYAEATTHIHATNTLLSSLSADGTRYDRRQHASEIDATINAFDPTWLARLGNAGHPSPRPVFLIGLPRSGTTLLEQILASHPDIAGIGEQGLATASFRHALRASGGHPSLLRADAVANAAAWHLGQIEELRSRLASGKAAIRVVDKMPDNYLLAAWLRVAFPNAAIIHCLRDPRDVAVSCWRTAFDAVPWSHDLHDIAHRIDQHRRLLRHWRRLFGQSLVDVRYERLVVDPESELRRALAAIGCPWHPGMLDFHAGGHYVGSASQRQVREPLNARGIGRWRRYEDALQPVIGMLDGIARMDAEEAGDNGAS